MALGALIDPLMVDLALHERVVQVLALHRRNARVGAACNQHHRCLQPVELRDRRALGEFGLILTKYHLEEVFTVQGLPCVAARIHQA